MTPRRVQVALAVLFGSAAVGLSISGLEVGAVIVGGLAAVQLVAVVAAPRVTTLAVVVFTDVVGSTEMIAEVGDAAWQKRFDEYLQVARRLLYRVPAAPVKDLGDGVLAAFPVPGATPSRVLAAVLRLSEGAGSVGLRTRTGVHFGRCSLSKRDARSLVVHIAARVMQTGQADQVVVTDPVRELVDDADLIFEPLGERTL